MFIITRQERPKDPPGALRDLYHCRCQEEENLEEYREVFSRNKFLAKLASG